MLAYSYILVLQAVPCLLPISVQGTQQMTAIAVECLTLLLLKLKQLH
jgi:hypothetical protein